MRLQGSSAWLPPSARYCCKPRVRCCHDGYRRGLLPLGFGLLHLHCAKREVFIRSFAQSAGRAIGNSGHWLEIASLAYHVMILELYLYRNYRFWLKHYYIYDRLPAISLWLRHSHRQWVTAWIKRRKGQQGQPDHYSSRIQKKYFKQRVWLRNYYGNQLWR